MNDISELSRKQRHDKYVGLITSIALLGDTLLLFLSLICAYYLRFASPIANAPFIVFAKVYSISEYTSVLAFGFITGILLMMTQGMYQKQHLLRFKFISLKIVRLVFFWFCGFLSLALIFKIEPMISRVYVVLASAIMLCFITVWRFALIHMLRSSPLLTHLRQRMLIIGWDDDSAKLVNAFKEDTLHPYSVYGCIPVPDKGFNNAPPPDIRRIELSTSFEAILDECDIEVVLLCELNTAWESMVEITNICERKHVEFKVLPSYHRVLLSGLSLESIGNIPILGLQKLPLEQMFNRIIKRSTDILGSLVGLLVFLPLIIFFSLLVILESPGIPCFSQYRIGKKGRRFKMLKIRSMKPGSQAESTYTVANDPRRLRIGRFMRRWNIDELPQFFNVLVGDMSLVGPRPEVAERSLELETEVPHYNARYNIKPGITGLSQIRGLRGDTDLGQRVISDLEYLESWSVWLDFHIMLRTIFAFKNAS